MRALTTGCVRIPRLLGSTREKVADNGPMAQKEPVQILRAEDDEVVTTPIETVQRVTRTQQVTLAAVLLLGAAYIEWRRR